MTIFGFLRPCLLQDQGRSYWVFYMHESLKVQFRLILPFAITIANQERFV